MNKQDQKNDFLAKVLIIGEANVGKTCILTQYTEGQFQINMIPTLDIQNKLILFYNDKSELEQIMRNTRTAKNKHFLFYNYILGIDYRIKRLKSKGHDIKLQIWDTAGQERFRAITQNFYKGAMGIILVFDLTDPKSFRTLSNWINNITQYSGSNVCRLLVGNKCDVSQNIIPRQDIDNLAKQYNIQYYETSAKNNKGIDEAFTKIAEDIVDKFLPDIQAQHHSNHNTNNNNQQNNKQNNNDLNGSIIKSPEELRKEEQGIQLSKNNNNNNNNSHKSNGCCS